MNSTSTHDTKRSEDVRARINVLSELPEEWARSLRRWSRMNPSESAPDRNEQVLIYQSMLGAWPIGADRRAQHAGARITSGLRRTRVRGRSSRDHRTRPAPGDGRGVPVAEEPV